MIQSWVKRRGEDAQILDVSGMKGRLVGSANHLCRIRLCCSRRPISCRLHTIDLPLSQSQQKRCLASVMVEVD